MKVLLILLLTAYANAEAPYPPSGFRPEGEPFTLPPSRFSQRPQNQFEARQPQQQYGAPPTSPPQGQYLPPSTNGQEITVRPLRNQYNPSEGSALRPEEQYVPPRPFRTQQYFRPQSQVQYEQSLPQLTSAPQTEYGAPQQPERFASFSPQDQLEPQTQYGAPTTEAPQEDLDEQRLIADQNRMGNFQEQRGGGNEGQIQGAKSDGRRVLRRRKQQRGDQNGGGNREVPASTYGVPTTSRNLYLAERTTEAFERESTTRPNKRLRTTTTRVDDSTNEAESEDTTGPNVSVATAVAGRYYLLQPNGQLQPLQLQVDDDGQNGEAGKQNGVTASLIVQNQNPFREPVYTFNAPLIRLSK